MKTQVVIPRGFDLCGVRQTRNLRLADVWKKSHIPYATLARIEHGERVTIAADDARRLCRVLGIDERTLERPPRDMVVDREVFSDQRAPGRRPVDRERIGDIARTGKVRGVRPEARR